MKIIDLNDMDELNSFFHFTNIGNLESIENKGLLPKKGENAFSLERTEKIFFSKGGIGTLEIIDAWIRWRIYKTIQAYYEAHNLSNCKEAFITGKGYTKEIIEKTFIDFYNYISNCVYLKLDLKEHEDFAYDDIDEIKKYFKKDEMLKKMYGPYSNIDSPIMESWNMHTFTNRIISPDKLSIIELNENLNALYIIKNLAEKYSCDNLYYLNEFLSFANEYDNKKSL